MPVDLPLSMCWFSLCASYCSLLTYLSSGNLFVIFLWHCRQMYSSPKSDRYSVWEGELTLFSPGCVYIFNALEVPSQIQLVVFSMHVYFCVPIYNKSWFYWTNFYVFVNENENFLRYKKYRTLRGFGKTCW